MVDSRRNGRRLGVISLGLLFSACCCTRSALASVIGSEQSNPLVEQIASSKGKTATALADAITAIWRAINHQDPGAAQRLIAQTQKQFQGWRPDGEMRYALAEQVAWNSVRKASLPEAEAAVSHFGKEFQTGPLAKKSLEAQAQMRAILVDRELWQALQKGETAAQIEERIHNAQQSLPGYQVPPALHAALATELAGESVAGLAKRQQWTAIVDLYRRMPAAFSDQYSANRQWLAQAEAEQGNLLDAARYYYQRLGHAKSLKSDLDILDQAADILPDSVISALYQTVVERYPDDRRVLQEWHLKYLIGSAARLHAAGQNERAWLQLQPYLTTIEARRQPANARLLASILGSLDRPRESLRWWFAAADWSGTQADWQTAGMIAMADGDLERVGQSLVHLSAHSASAKPIFAWYYQQRALQAYKNKKYQEALRDLDESKKSQALAPGLQSIRAWSLLHLHHDKAASREFSALYRESPDLANASGIVLTDFAAHTLSHSYHLAQQRQGPLASLLPMSAMAEDPQRIDQIPWRLATDGHIELPPARASYLLLGAAGMWRGGQGGGSSHFNAAFPGWYGQWGLNWHLAAFATMTAPYLSGNAASLGVTLRDQAGTTLESQAEPPSKWLAPGFLLGLDDARPGQTWRAGIGWTSPSIIGGGTVQGLLQYRQYFPGSSSYWQVEVLREPVQQSWISYHGVQGALTLVNPDGQTIRELSYQWGAAMHNQLGGSIYFAGRRPNSWSYLASAHLDAITGYNLRNNLGWTSYLSAMKPVLSNDHWWGALGPALYSEGYARNENFSSAGYGNYYSPSWLLQPQLAAAISHWWSDGKASLAASLGYQWARTAAAPFVGSASLQSELASSATGEALADAEYPAARTGSISGAVSLLLSQQLATHWFFDASASYQASPAFAQTQVGLGLQYVFSGNGKPDLGPARFVGNLWRQEP